MAKYFRWWAIRIPSGGLSAWDNPALSEDALRKEKFRVTVVFFVSSYCLFEVLTDLNRPFVGLLDKPKDAYFSLRRRLYVFHLFNSLSPARACTISGIELNLYLDTENYLAHHFAYRRSFCMDTHGIRYPMRGRCHG
jgi:hypothetical protein